MRTFSSPRALALACLLAVGAQAAERSPVTPPNAPAPVGPYSPGVWGGSYLYVSGQGARDGKNQLPGTPEQQSTQCLENVRAIVEAAGLSMRNVVYLQAYLADLNHRPAFEKALAQAFPKIRLAYSLVSVARMPTDTPVEISAVALRDPQGIRRSRQATSTPDRTYVAGQTGATVQEVTGKLRRAGVTNANALALTAYHTSTVNAAQAEQALKEAFAAAVTLVEVASLPDGAALQVTGIATRRDQAKKQAGACTAADGVAYCAAHLDRTGADVATQTVTLLDALDKSFQAVGTRLSNAVVSHVYLDELSEFAAMNKAYASRFASPFPTRTTVQPVPSTRGSAPRVRVSVIALQP